VFQNNFQVLLTFFFSLFQQAFPEAAISRVAQTAWSIGVLIKEARFNVLENGLSHKPQGR